MSVLLMLEISSSHSEFCKHCLVPWSSEYLLWPSCWACLFGPFICASLFFVFPLSQVCLTVSRVVPLVPIISAGPILYFRTLPICLFLSHPSPTTDHLGSSSQAFWTPLHLGFWVTRTSSSRFVSFECFLLWSISFQGLVPCPLPDTVTSPLLGQFLNVRVRSWLSKMSPAIYGTSAFGWG